MLHNTCLSLSAVEADQVAKCACTTQCTPSPKQHSDKSLSQHSYTLVNGHKEQKNDRRGPGTKVRRDPGPHSSFVQKNGEVQEQLLLAARGHLRRPSPPPSFSPENKVWSCECAGFRGTREGCMYKTKGTLCQINAELTSPSSPIHPADQQRGWVGVWGRGPKVREEAFKVDVSHISHGTKESQRCTIWTQPHPPLRSHSKEPSSGQWQHGAVHSALPSDNTALPPDWLPRCRL